MSFKKARVFDRTNSTPAFLSAGGITDFIYEISGNISDKHMQEINHMDTKDNVRVRIKAIKDKGFSLEFLKVANEVFNLNLQFIDSKMPDILAFLLKYFYIGKADIVKDLIEFIQIINPCNFNSTLGHEFYEHKVKKFMIGVALGMNPSKVWTGEFDTTSGHVVIKEDKEMLCYHVYNHDELQNYLLNNVKFETLSNSRHDFGKIYKVNNEYFINLNLQLRFI